MLILAADFRVYSRRPMATKKKKKKRKSTAKAAKLAHGSKSEFVRTHPGMPAAELAALAKKQGVALTPGLIYNIRAADKRRSGKNGRVTGRAARSNGSNENQLRSLVMRMGLDSADAVFTELREQMKNLE